MFAKRECAGSSHSTLTRNSEKRKTAPGSVLRWENIVILDTNMILRYLLNDDQEMADIAEQYLNAGDASVTIEVIAEVVYVLKGVYSMDRDVIAETVKGFLELVNCQEMAVLNLALDTYGNFEKPCFRKHCLGKKPCFTGFSEVMYAAK